MELRSLRYFVAVAQAESLGKAALLLNMAQPPLSVQIRNLERQVGAELFVRTARGMQLTDAGQALLVRARDALALAQEGLEAARAVAAGRRGRLIIGYMFALGYSLLPRLVPVLRRVLPDVELQFLEMSARNHAQLLLEHRVNVAISMPPILHDEIRSVTVGSEPLRLAVARHSPLAALRAVPVSRLQDARLIGLPPGHGGPETSIVSAMLRRHRVTPATVHRVETVHAALALVLAGEGVAIVPGCVAPLVPKGVLLRPLQRVGDRLEIAVCWRRDAVLSSADAIVEATRGSL